MSLHFLDIVVLSIYVISLITVAYLVSRERPGHTKNTEDYFLASKSLPWWAVGASLIASNISAEQIIGMAGSGYVVGLAIASYEWMAALALLIVGKYFLPIFLRHKIYTMPQFLEQRYDYRVKMVMAIFWLGVYIFVNLTSILWLGALAIRTITGIDLVYGMLLLGGFSLAYSLYGGLKAVAMTDIIQVAVLFVGGIILSVVVLFNLADNGGILAGISTLMERAPEKFDLILSPNHPEYINLPGISVIIGGIWIMNLSYWGCNQYIIQRTLAAGSLREGQKGIIFAAYLKIIMPIIVVLPGIAAAIISPGLERSDEAYPTMMQHMPIGIKGLVFAALVAAIVSSLSSMMNSISTIFTMDLYVRYRPNQKETHYVTVGRLVSLTCLVIAMLCARPLLGHFDQAFQYIQEFTGFFTPGIVSLFLLGLFWKKTNANGALSAAIASAFLSPVFKILFPALPFIERVGWVFVLCMAIGMLVSHWTHREEGSKAVELDDIQFTTDKTYNIGAVGVVLILYAIYLAWQ